MDNENDVDPYEPEPMVHTVSKLLLGTLAGFVAGQLVRTAYDVLVEKSRSTDATTEDTEV